MNRIPSPLPAAPRKGSVLLVVLGLLMLLMLIGLTFFTFASIEQSSSLVFTETAKLEPDIPLDQMWNWGLYQIILGADHTTAPQSVLDVPLYSPGTTTQVGSRYSLRGNMQGNDAMPYNGQGIHLLIQPSTATNPGAPYVDQTYDGTADNPTFLNLSISPAAYGNTVTPSVYSSLPQPDVDYTYPDHNNPFLAFVGYIYDNSYPLGDDGAYGQVNFDDDNDGTKDNASELGWTGSDDYQRFVIIPSFHRPQLLRNPTTGYPYPKPVVVSGALTNQATAWSTNPATAMMVFRPHPSHVIQGTTTPRYILPTNTTAKNALGNSVNPFPFATGKGGGVLSQGVFDVSALPLPATVFSYTYDVDNDGDGIAEGILMDLGYPPQKTAKGETYVPLFSVTIMDADGLINLNTHGNLYGLNSLNTSAANPLGYDSVYGLPLPYNAGNPNTVPLPVSRSNLGLMPSEVNPAYALNADPSNELPTTKNLTQYSYLFPGSGGRTISRIEMANMELVNLMMGRGEMTGTTSYKDLYVGRFGDRNQLVTGLTTKVLANFPRPGAPNNDDNADGYEGIGNGTSNPEYTNFGHPLDYYGTGTRFSNRTSAMAAANGVTQDYAGKTPQLNSTAGSPAKWPAYSGYHSGVSVPNVANTNLVKWFLGDSGNLMWNGGLVGTLNNPFATPMATNAGPSNQLTDDMMETVFEAIYKQAVDEIFDAEEMEGLQRNPNDADYKTAVVSRLKQLMPFNFDDSTRADAIRQRFTVVSNDRNNFNFAQIVGQRVWEVNADVNNNTFKEFPPVFSTTTAGTLNYNEPFRPELRKLLEMETGSSLRTRLQFRLNLNQFLTSVHNDNYKTTSDTTGTSKYYPTPSNIAAQYPNVTLYYRPVTPHPTTTTSTSFLAKELPCNGASAATPPPPPGNALPSGSPWTVLQQQEYWARRDRQQMARDIYVLLYTLGSGSDATTASPVTNSSSAVYSATQLKEMAQFAVNLVDALDRDSAITIFEYDMDLSNGWNLDDNPYNTLGISPIPTAANPASTLVSAGDTNPAERNVVVGVEAQQATINEVMAFRLQINGASGDFAPTIFDESSDPTGLARYYTYIELANASPSAVNLANGSWRIKLACSSATTPVVYLTPKTGSIPVNGRFTIGSAGRSDLKTDYIIPMSSTSPSYLSADFRLAIQNAGAFDRVVPNVADASTPNKTTSNPPACDLDLVYNNSGGTPTLWTMTDVNGNPLNTPGSLLNSGTAGDNLNITLERRLHLGRATPLSTDLTATAEEADNPWVTVDTFSSDQNAFQPQILDLQFAIGATAPYATERNVLQSSERAQPLDRSSHIQLRNTNATTVYNNIQNPVKYSLMSANAANGITNPNVWQPHFDRDFASTMDLLTIPLYDCSQVTQMLAKNNQVVNKVTIGSTTYRTTAQGRFLRPQHPDNDPNSTPPGVNAASPILTKDNRWYRLFEFVEVPSRAHKHPFLTSSQTNYLNSPYARYLTTPLRSPGKINLNTIRHREVFAGLLDDPLQFNPNTFLDTNYDAARNWWQEFCKSRDGSWLGTWAGTGTPWSVKPDPVTGLFIPGMPGSQPFRGLSIVGPTNANAATPDAALRSLDQTILRRLPLDIDSTVGVNPADPRHLFEIGTNPDHTVSSGSYTDPHTRHRLLSKIYGNTTTRSHVFYCWMTVQFHEAVETTAGSNQWQIGAQVSGMVNHRMFCVIDRSSLEKMYGSRTGLNYKPLVLFQRTIE